MNKLTELKESNNIRFSKNEFNLKLKFLLKAFNKIVYPETCFF